MILDSGRKWLDSAWVSSFGVPRRAMFLIATLFGISSTLQMALHMRLNDEKLGGEWLPLAAVNLVYWYVPATLAPVIMAVAARYQLARTSWWTQFSVHGVGALLYSVVHTATMFGFRFVLSQVVSMPPLPVRRSFWVRVGSEYFMQFDWLLMTYLFFVGLAHALAYRGESERRALESAQLETRLVEARLQSLQRQLHPHFLFNTLNTIAGLIRTNVNAADQMIDQLGDLLRMALHSSEQQVVPLEQELQALRKYLEIEQTRLGSRLTVYWQIDPESLDAEVPTLLLQPLAENAVRHGVAPHSRPGRITVAARRVGDRLTLEVRDSGYGVEPERLRALNGGVGLSNTRARLKHLFPSTHTFGFANVADGFSVTVEIPYGRGAAEQRTMNVEVA